MAGVHCLSMMKAGKRIGIVGRFAVHQGRGLFHHTLILCIGLFEQGIITFAF